jgi:hypothetical protein
VEKLVQLNQHEEEIKKEVEKKVKEIFDARGMTYRADQPKSEDAERGSSVEPLLPSVLNVKVDWDEKVVVSAIKKVRCVELLDGHRKRTPSNKMQDNGVNEKQKIVPPPAEPISSKDFPYSIVPTTNPTSNQSNGVGTIEISSVEVFVDCSSIFFPEFGTLCGSFLAGTFEAGKLSKDAQNSWFYIWKSIRTALAGIGTVAKLSKIQLYLALKSNETDQETVKERHKQTKASNANDVFKAGENAKGDKNSKRQKKKKERILATEVLRNFSGNLKQMGKEVCYYLCC